jgi:hypothetical protein
MRGAAVSVMLFLLLCSLGCSTYRIDQTGRRYIDQLVATRSIDRAVEKLEIPAELRGESFYLEPVSASSMEEGYAAKAVSNKLIREGMSAASSANEARYIARLMIKAAGVDVLTSDVDVPAPFSQASVSFYSSMEEKGYAELSLFFIEREGGTFAAEVEPVQGGSYFKRSRVFFIGPITFQDIHEPGVMDNLVREAKQSLKKKKK